MRKFTSKEEIESLCEAMIRDYFRKRHYTDVLCVDIEDFVERYLGVPVVYEAFAEEDPGRIGYLSDGNRPLWVRRKEGKAPVVFPEGTAVIEKMLLHPSESARRRFTIAHEGAHRLLERHAPQQFRPLRAFFSEYEKETDYSPELLREMLSVNEMFANRAAACLLMPRFLMEKILKKRNGGKRIPLYEGGIVGQADKLKIQKMADDAGVSYTALFHRLRELRLFEERPVEEYLHGTLAFGGEETC